MKRIAALLGLSTAAFALWLGHIGYIGAPIFTDVVATPAAGHSEVAAVLLSGDMGFKVGMGPRIALRLAARGIPVVGINSLAFFGRRRTPAETAALITDASRHALAFGKARRLLLIGQSFGADMLHVGLLGMPQDIRAKVQLVALIVPGDSIDFRASPAELFNLEKPDGPALPTARQLDWAPVVCIYGIEEEYSLCPSLHLPILRKVVLPGGHPLRHDVGAIFAALTGAMRWADAMTAERESQH